MLAMNIVYQTPIAAVFLFATPLWLLLFVRLFRHREHAASQFGGTLGRQLRGRTVYTLQSCLYIASWMLISLALMQPVLQTLHVQEPTPVSQPTGAVPPKTSRRLAHDVVILLDTSKSMLVRDTDLGQSRFDFAKEFLDELVLRLPGDSVAFYPFNSDLQPLVPPTLDHLYLRMKLRDLDVGETMGSGTDLVSTLSDLAVHLRVGSSDKVTTVVLLTDGGDTEFEQLKEPERSKRLEEIVDAVADEKNTAIVAIGLGSTQGAFIPDFEYKGAPVVSALLEAPLEALAEQSEGAYFVSRRRTSLNLAEDVAQWIQQRVDQEAQRTRKSLFKVLGAVSPLADGVNSYPLTRWFVALSLLFLLAAVAVPDVDVGEGS